MNSFRTFRCLTVISVVHMVRNMLTLRLQLLEVFRLHVMPRHVFETKRRKRKPVKHQFFQNLKFCFCDFWNALNVMQKPFRNRSRRERENSLLSLTSLIGSRGKLDLFSCFVTCDVWAAWLMSTLLRRLWKPMRA